jgi:putative spermidine/putrescine transport system ATP-binding protein
MPPPLRSLPVAVRGLSKAYGRVRALDDVTLAIESGEFVTLLGPSGSGKTTLLMVLAGFVRPDAGSVTFGGEEMVRTPPHRRQVGMVFQNYALFPHMDVFQNVAFPLRLRGVPPGEVARRVGQALALVRLEELTGRRVDQLSGGQRQRVALARAIVFEPRILLMDEPLSALDKKLREQMQIELKHLHAALGMTTVYVTHDQREALTMSDRVAVIDRGRLVQVDTPRALYERPRTRFVAEFVGESSCLPVEVGGGEARLGGVALRLARSPEAAAPRQLLVLRPEKLEVLADGGGAGLNRLGGTVRELVYQGESVLVYVALAGGGEIAVRSPSRQEAVAALPAPGEPIQLGLHPEDAILVPEEA